MIGTFVIWVEDRWGNTVRAFTWYGRAKDGIARARSEAHAKGIPTFDIWTTPLANTGGRPT